MDNIIGAVDKYNLSTPQVSSVKRERHSQETSGNTTVVCLNTDCKFRNARGVCGKNWIKLSDRKCIDYKEE